MEYLWLTLIAVGGGLIQTTVGFGLGIFVMAFFPFFLPMATSVTVSCLFSLIGSIWVCWAYRKKIRFRLLVFPLLGFFVSNTLTTIFAVQQNDTLLKRILGIFLIILSFYFIFFSSKIHIRPTRLNGSIAGLLGGVTHALFSIGGPPVVIFYLAALEDKDEYLATIQTYFLICNIYTLSVRASVGLVTANMLLLTLAGFVGLAAGVFIGAKIYSRLNKQNLLRLVYGFMMLTGIWITIAG